MPPGTPRSRSLTRLTMRVGLPHLGQSVLFDVSITFLRSAVLAILAMAYLDSPKMQSLPREPNKAARIGDMRLPLGISRQKGYLPQTQFYIIALSVIVA